MPLVENANKKFQGLPEEKEDKNISFTEVPLDLSFETKQVGGKVLKYVCVYIVKKSKKYAKCGCQKDIFVKHANLDDYHISSSSRVLSFQRKSD